MIYHKEFSLNGFELKGKYQLDYSRLVILYILYISRRRLRKSNDAIKDLQG